MAEAIGTAIGVVGFLGQLFDGCVKAYGYFSAAAGMDADSARLLCKVRIEEMRLVVWGREWGVAEGRLEAHLRSGGCNPQMAALAEGIMRELHATVTDFQRLRERYGLVDGEGGRERMVASGAGEKVKQETDRSWRREFSRRAKWVIADKDKFTALLKDLKDFNDGLEQLFPPSRLPSLHRAWRHSLLDSAARDVAQLSLLESSSEDSYPQLGTSANLKKLRINLDAKPQASFKPTFAFKVPRSDLELPGPEAVAATENSSGSNKSGKSSKSKSSSSNGGAKNDSSETRTHATHRVHGPVLVEWVEYDPSDPEERFLHLRRLDDLARMMHSASDRHPDLHTTDCLGYTDDKEHARYGLVYKCPRLPLPSVSAAEETKGTEAATPAAAATSHSTLFTLISSPDLKTPDLDDRVALASTLACALWSLHSLDWLHKSLCSANILFFPSAVSAAATRDTASAAVVPDVSRPYLVGFDASRPDMDAEVSVNPRNPSILDLHREPRSLGVRVPTVELGGERRGQYCKTYDIYSLGLVLLEIGLWKPLQTYYKPHYSAERWRDRVVMPVLVPGLGAKTGKVYKKVVERCLTARDGMSSGEAGQVMEWVVTTLEGIRT
ncbi:hypothetical protein CSOJ01_09268 [Colletotrichum sojae]|uniref:Prion-inhibition and propagation HeLo domain-containing protein n=1 Tax=Colletotrichum sojae TaxID=2175907 RepID=A0A8H6J4C4_9PEZI|nr:hypothetical protein CSOJ01_09268 [Colletotrichum sojae]